MRILADENMPGVQAGCESLGYEVTLAPGRDFASYDLSQFDALLIRSVTRVDEALLKNSNVKFVGSATIGTDHVDRAWLAHNQIEFAHAPGCNAQSVVDWVLAVMAVLQVDHQLDWRRKTFGVIGCGQVGERLATRLETLGCRVLRCDPPRFDAGTLAEQEPLESVIEQADIICAHTPLTNSGKHATQALFSEKQLNQLKANQWLINAGRGPVIKETALLQAKAKTNFGLVLDVWPQEPDIAKELMAVTQLGSPHIAGYSADGKLAGTRQVLQALQNWLGKAADFSLPEPAETPNHPWPNNKGLTLEDQIAQYLLAGFDPREDDAALRAIVNESDAVGRRFDALRKHYRNRRELAYWRVSANTPEAAKLKLAALGLRPE